MSPSSRNDFTGYTEAHALIEESIENCRGSSGNKKEERAGWLIDTLPRAEKVLRRYGLDDRWCSRRNNPKLRFRWAAMNPCSSEQSGTEEYSGSEALDPALADRFALFVQAADWAELTTEERLLAALHGPPVL